jgi:hypothetical protein
VVGPRCEPCTLDAIRGDIQELTEQHEHVEAYHIRDPRSRRRRAHRHAAWHPPLLVQLQDVAQRRGSAAVSYEALDLVKRIMNGARAWRDRIHYRAETRCMPIDHWWLLPVRDLADAAPRLSRRNQRRLAADVHRWWTWCRVIGGWEDWPPQIHAPCPRCDALPKPRGLRVRMDRSAAYCATCDATWDTDTIGVLAAHITAYERNHRARTD